MLGMPPLFVPSDWAIVPGRSLGHVRIGANPSSVFDEFGKPSSEDAAMGKAWATWFGPQGGRLDIFSSRSPDADSRDRVKVLLVRVTSTKFRLASGLHTGSSSERFKRAYPRARTWGRYRSSVGRVTIWDDVRCGLAWETTPSGAVLAITVHAAGEPLPESFSLSIRGAVR
jgi:hypothetical protein